MTVCSKNIIIPIELLNCEYIKRALIIETVKKFNIYSTNSGESIEVLRNYQHVESLLEKCVG